VVLWGAERWDVAGEADREFEARFGVEERRRARVDWEAMLGGSKWEWPSGRERAAQPYEVVIASSSSWGSEE